MELNQPRTYPPLQLCNHAIRLQIVRTLHFFAHLAIRQWQFCVFIPRLLFVCAVWVGGSASRHVLALLRAKQDWQKRCVLTQGEPTAALYFMFIAMYRAEKKSWQILLSSTQAGPGRKVKQEQEDISRNHVPRLFLGSV